MGDVMSDLFRPAAAGDRARGAADLLQRAGLARTYGWGGVLLAGICETVQSTWWRWAGELCGLDDGLADIVAGCPATRGWFAVAQAQR